MPRVTAAAVGAAADSFVVAAASALRTAMQTVTGLGYPGPRHRDATDGGTEEGDGGEDEGRTWLRLHGKCDGFHGDGIVV